MQTRKPSIASTSWQSATAGPTENAFMGVGLVGIRPALLSNCRVTTCKRLYCRLLALAETRTPTSARENERNGHVLPVPAPLFGLRRRQNALEESGQAAARQRHEAGSADSPRRP